MNSSIKRGRVCRAHGHLSANQSVCCCREDNIFSLTGYFICKKKINSYILDKKTNNLWYYGIVYIYISWCRRDFQDSTCNRPTNKNATLPHQIPHCASDSERDILVTRVYFKSFQIDLVYAPVQLFCSSSLQLKSTVFFNWSELHLKYA